MKRIRTLPATCFITLREPYRWTCTAVALLLILITSVGSANAQSRDRDNPTKLNSNEISGLIGDNIGDNYYYAFVAGPGELTITLSVEAGRVYHPQINAVSFDLFNEDARTISMRQVLAVNGSTEQAVERISFTRRQHVLLRIIISDNNLGSGKYRLRLAGAVDVSQDRSRISGLTLPGDLQEVLKTQAPSEQVAKCLPKKGVLLLKMKDGSIRKIDLSQIQDLNIIEPER